MADPTGSARLRELAVRQARRCHVGSRRNTASLDHPMQCFELCPHPDCVLVRASVPSEEIPATTEDKKRALAAIELAALVQSLTKENAVLRVSVPAAPAEHGALQHLVDVLLGDGYENESAPWHPVDVAIHEAVKVLAASASPQAPNPL